MANPNLILGIVVCAVLGALPYPVDAVEGMWPPNTLPELREELLELGLSTDPSSLTDLTAHPMNAVISLGGCTASFVSPQGLVITNHHCAARAIQYNSTPEQNLLEQGFLAAARSDELAAGPGSRVLVTVAFEDVSDSVLGGLPGGLGGLERFRAIEDREKELVSRCEENAGHRCSVRAYHGGLQYYLIKQFEILDVRLVYAPAGGIGNFGGDIDNWMWPRHTGDYSFFRAYVGTDGKPARFDAANVPYQPAHHLKVSRDGLQQDGFVMVPGYPGRTNRYRLASEVEQAVSWYYPLRKRLREEWLEIVERETRERPDAAIRYAGLVSGLNNAVKNYGGLLDGFAEARVVERRRAAEATLREWVAADPARKQLYGAALSELEALIQLEQSTREREMFYDELVRRAALLRAATSLYRLSKEREKPDEKREPGYQVRDIERFRERLIRLERTFDPAVDRAVWRHFILAYAAIPAAQHVADFDAWFGIREGRVDETQLEKTLTAMYAQTALDEKETRLGWVEAAPEKFERSEDPFLRLAVTLYDSDIEIEQREKELQGRLRVLRPKYMEALIAYRAERGAPVYPDANGTLRVTYGTVQGYSPRDAVIYTPFTRLEGILQKETGVEPFDAPPALLAAIRAGELGGYRHPRLDSVTVNFLSDVDTTGGNSGSPTLNGNGELVGLLFDGTWESIIADWDYNAETARSIHVDMRYVLWIMEYVDGAHHLLREMDLDPGSDGT